MIFQSTSPLFTNDFIGFAKIIGVIAGTVLLPCGALIVYFLKQGPHEELAKFRSELNGLGARVDNVTTDITKVETKVDTIQTSIRDSQRDILEALRASSTEQMQAVHRVELKVERIQVGNDFAECIGEFAKAIEKLVDKIEMQRQRS